MSGYQHPDGCAGCQAARPARPAVFSWQEPFVMMLCTPCVLGLLLARPVRRLRALVGR